jgi:hypothetical protein
MTNVCLILFGPSKSGPRGPALVQRSGLKLLNHRLLNHRLLNERLLSERLL